MRKISLRPMNFESIIEQFCHLNEVTKEALNAHTRTKDLIYKRYIIWHYLHVKNGVSAGVIAKHFNRNVPSIFRGIRILKCQMFFHKDVNNLYTLLTKGLEGASSDTPSDDMEEE